MTKSKNRSASAKVWSMLNARERSRTVLIMGLALVGVLLEMFGITLVIPMILIMTQENLSSSYPQVQPIMDALGNPDQSQLIIGGMLTLVAVYLLKSAYLLLLTWYRTRFIFSVRVRISKQLFVQYLRQPYVYHLQQNSSKLIRNIVTEVHQATVTSMSSGIALFTDGAVLIGLSLVLLYIEPMGTLIVAAVLGAAAGVFQLSTKNFLTNWSEQRIHHEGLRLQYVQQGLSGIKDVKLLGRETDVVDRFVLHTSNAARVGRNQQVLSQTPRVWLELLAVCGMATLVITIVQREESFTSVISTIALFGAAAFRMLPSVNKVLGSVQSLRYLTPVIDNIHDDFFLPTEPSQQNGSNPFKLSNAIEAKEVTFSYPNTSTPSLHNVSLSIPRGHSVGFVGSSGSGKSTLVDVLLGLLTPQSGEILVDGVNIQNDVRSWKNQIGYVSQVIYLTDDTLRRNVAFGLSEDEIDDEAVDRAIKAAQLDEFVQKLPEGLETIVGERGVKLSGGQRQRIGIARALYHDPEVLVLDEATSSLDSETEAEVMQAINAMHGLKTILIVAHRLSTIEDCDIVFRLDSGRLINSEFNASLFEAPPAADQLGVKQQ